MVGTVVDVELASYKRCLALTFAFVDNDVEVKGYKLTKCDVIFDLHDGVVKLKDFNKTLGPSLAKELGDNGVKLELSESLPSDQDSVLVHYNVVEAPPSEDPYDTLTLLEELVSTKLMQGGFKLLGIERNVYEKYDGVDFSPAVLSNETDKTLN